MVSLEIVRTLPISKFLLHFIHRSCERLQRSPSNTSPPFQLPNVIPLPLPSDLDPHIILKLFQLSTDSIYKYPGLAPTNSCFLTHPDSFLFSSCRSTPTVSSPTFYRVVPSVSFLVSITSIFTITKSFAFTLTLCSGMYSDHNFKAPQSPCLIM